MSEKEARKDQEAEIQVLAKSQETEPCSNMTDPVRKGLCRVCQLPVVGEAPFCKDHEPPVP
ncbi:MAG: hypothetical protein AB7V04_13860 [Desulfomonilaceae bacterium]